MNDDTGNREDADDEISLSQLATRIASLSAAAGVVLHSLADRERAEAMAIDLTEVAAELAAQMAERAGRLGSRVSL